MSVTFDGLWVIYRPAQTRVRPKSNHAADLIYGIGDTKDCAWENAARVLYPTSDPIDMKPELKRLGYSAKRATMLVEA